MSTLILVLFVVGAVGLVFAIGINIYGKVKGDIKWVETSNDVAGRSLAIWGACFLLYLFYH